MTLHEGFENEIAKSFIGFISNVCIFAASYEVKAKVIKGKTRSGIQPQNTEYLFFYPEIKPRDVLSQVAQAGCQRQSCESSLSLQTHWGMLISVD